MDTMNTQLPEIAYHDMPGQPGRIIAIHKGESGYYPVEAPEGATASELNSIVGVTPAQAEAMLVGSMFGWDVPGANPALYTSLNNR